MTQSGVEGRQTSQATKLFKWCSFLEKFERILNKIVKVLARLAPLGSLLRRGAFTLSLPNVPPRRASIIFYLIGGSRQI